MAGLAQVIPRRDVALHDVPQQLSEDSRIALAQECGKASVIPKGRERSGSRLAAPGSEILRVAEREYLERELSARELRPELASQQRGIGASDADGSSEVEE